jgi:PIN domain
LALRRRAVHLPVCAGRGDKLAAACPTAVETDIVILDEAIQAALEDEARARSQRDPEGWPVVATALALTADLRANDNDFLGGVATWTTDEEVQLFADGRDECASIAGPTSRETDHWVRCVRWFGAIKGPVELIGVFGPHGEREHLH